MVNRELTNSAVCRNCGMPIKRRTDGYYEIYDYGQKYIFPPGPWVHNEPQSACHEKRLCSGIVAEPAPGTECIGR